MSIVFECVAQTRLLFGEPFWVVRLPCCSCDCEGLVVKAQLGSASGPSQSNPSPWHCCTLPGARHWPRRQRESWSLCKVSSSPLATFPGRESCQRVGAVDQVDIPAAGALKLVWCFLLDSQVVLFCLCLVDANAGAIAGSVPQSQAVAAPGLPHMSLICPSCQPSAPGNVSFGSTRP